jgi:hypothetical protein
MVQNRQKFLLRNILLVLLSNANRLLGVTGYSCEHDGTRRNTATAAAAATTQLTRFRSLV